MAKERGTVHACTISGLHFLTAAYANRGCEQELLNGPACPGANEDVQRRVLKRPFANHCHKHSLLCLLGSCGLPDSGSKETAGNPGFMRVVTAGALLVSVQESRLKVLMCFLEQ